MSRSPDKIIRMDYYRNEENFKSLSGYDIDGMWFPRVTKIVEIKAKPALYKYYANLPNFEKGEEIKKQSASEGTEIHEAVEYFLINQKEPEMRKEIRPAFDAFLKFYEQNKIQTDPEFVERRVANYDERFAGTIDAVALINGKFGVLDIKTSVSIFRDYNLQTSAYAATLEKELPTLQTRWILRIDQNQICKKCYSTMRTKGGEEKIRLAWDARDKSVRIKAEKCQHEWSEQVGSVELKEFPYWENDFRAFLGAKKLWEWENEYWLKKVGYLL